MMIGPNDNNYYYYPIFKNTHTLPYATGTWLVTNNVTQVPRIMQLKFS